MPVHKIYHPHNNISIYENIDSDGKISYYYYWYLIQDGREFGGNFKSFSECFEDAKKTNEIMNGIKDDAYNYLVTELYEPIQYKEYLREYND